MSETNIGLSREIRELNNERALYNKVLSSEQQRLADMFRGTEGQEMKDILAGKKIVKLPFKDRFKYKINFWINKILNIL